MRSLIVITAAVVLAGCATKGAAPKPTASLFHDYLNDYQLKAPQLNYQDRGAALQQADFALFTELNEALLSAPDALQPTEQKTEYATAVVNWIEQQAQRGNRAAQLHLGSLYWLQADWPQAQHWLSKVADRDAWAQYLLALAYANPQFPHHAMEKSQQWLQKASDQGLADARRLLAWRYVKGDGVPQNWPRARALYQALAGENDQLATAQLGLMQLFGVGGERDSAAAINTLKTVAELPAVAYSLALSYRYGVGVSANPEQAHHYLQQATAQQFALAANQQGQWLAVDTENLGDQALAWFRKAITAQSVQPQFNLGLSYWQGLGTPQDLERARKWLQPIQERSLEARKLLAYLATIDQPFGEKLAIELSEQGIEQGDAYSFYLKGVLLARGQHVPQNRLQAYALLNVASALGYKPATEVRDSVLSQLSHAQRAEGQNLSQQMFNRLQATLVVSDAGE